MQAWLSRSRGRAGLQQLARHQGRGRRLAEPDRHVETLADQIAQLVAGHQLQREVGIALQEPVQMRRQQQTREEGVDVHPQPAAHGCGRAGGLGDYVLDSGQQRADLGIEPAALVGQGQGAGGAVQQPYADPLLQPGQGAADARGRQAQHVGGLGQAAALHDRRQHPDIGDQPSIEGHRTIHD
jgi:hypothetical protein